MAVTPKNKKQYTIVSFECPEVFEGTLELPDANEMPPSVALGLNTGRAKDMVKFLDWLEANGSEGIIDVFDSIADDEEGFEAFTEAWAEASEDKAPKSEKSAK